MRRIKLTNAILVSAYEIMGVVQRLGNSVVGIDVQSGLLKGSADDGKTSLSVETLSADLTYGGSSITALNVVETREASAPAAAAATTATTAATTATVFSAGTAVAPLRAAVPSGTLSRAGAFSLPAKKEAAGSVLGGSSNGRGEGAEEE